LCSPLLEKALEPVDLEGGDENEEERLGERPEDDATIGALVGGVVRVNARNEPLLLVHDLGEVVGERADEIRSRTKTGFFQSRFEIGGRGGRGGRRRRSTINLKREDESERAIENRLL
jgi:hypothetical protein